MNKEENHIYMNQQYNVAWFIKVTNSNSINLIDFVIFGCQIQNEVFEYIGLYKYST